MNAILWLAALLTIYSVIDSELSTLCFALMNSVIPYTNQVRLLLERLTLWTWDTVKLLQSPYFFCPFTPTLLIPPPLPTGILYSPQFRLHQETDMAAHWTQWLTSIISWKYRGPGQSIVKKMTATSWRFQSVCGDALDKVLKNLYVYTETIRLFALDFYGVIEILSS